MLPPCLWAFLGVSMNLMRTLQGPWEVGMEGVVMTITNTLAFAPAPPPKSSPSDLSKMSFRLWQRPPPSLPVAPNLTSSRRLCGIWPLSPSSPYLPPGYSHIRLLAVPRMLRAPSLSCLVAFEPDVPSPWNTCPQIFIAWLLFIRKV